MDDYDQLMELGRRLEQSGAEPATNDEVRAIKLYRKHQRDKLEEESE